MDVFSDVLATNEKLRDLQLVRSLAAHHSASSVADEPSVRTGMPSKGDRCRRFLAGCDVVAMSLKAWETFISFLKRQPTSRRCQRIALTQQFFFAGIGLISLNTIALCCDYPRASDQLKRALFWANFGFVGCFLIEALIRIAGLGIAVYFSTRLELVDIVIILTSVFECVASLVADSGGKSNFGALRLLRLLRITRLAKLFRLRSLRQVFDTIFSSLSSLGALCALITMFGFMFAVVGMQLFGGKFREPSRQNFDSFRWAVMTVFQIISGENYDVSVPRLPNAHSSPTATL